MPAQPRNNTPRVPFRKLMAKSDAHQGVMTDRRHSLKRGDTKKERQTTASDWKK